MSASSAAIDKNSRCLHYPPAIDKNSRCLHYPPAIAAPKTPYENTPQNNPVLAGTSLSIAASVIANFGPIQQILWNGNFAPLHKLDATGAIDSYDARFDPTVIPISPGDEAASSKLEIDTASTEGDCFRSSADYIKAYKSGELTPTDVAERLLKLFEQPEYASYLITPTPADELRAAAEASTFRWRNGTPLLLDGVPLVVKDEVDVVGYPKTMGLSFAEAKRRKIGELEKKTGQSTWCVQKLLDAGMLLLGMSNMHEIGLDTTNNNPNHGTPLNPFNETYYPGGSSGGSAAIVGRGLVPIAVGADGGGSIRVPSTYCGVYGLKPTHSRVSSLPTQSMASSNGVVGPIAATMDDLAIAFRLMSQPNPSDPNNSSSKFFSGFKASSTKTLGIYRPWFENCDPEVLTHVNAAISIYKSKLGYEVIDIELPYLAECRAAHAITILTEIGVYFMKGDVSGLSPANKVMVAVSTRTPASTIYIANKLRSMMMSHLAHLFTTYPSMIIVTPTVPHLGVKIGGANGKGGGEGSGHAKKGGAGASDANASLKTMQYVFLANWTGCPSISMPVGYDEKENMPAALMGMAEWGCDEALLEWGKEWDNVFRAAGAGSAEEDVKAQGVATRRRGAVWEDLLKA